MDEACLELMARAAEIGRGGTVPNLADDPDAANP